MKQDRREQEGPHRSTKYSNLAIVCVIVILVFVWFTVGLLYAVIVN